MDILVGLDIENETKNNIFYRQVISTTNEMQLVLMSVKPNDSIPREKHDSSTQFIRIEKGSGLAILEFPSGTIRYELNPTRAVLIPAGTYHTIVNTSPDENLKLYALYAPPVHDPQEIERFRSDE